MDLDPEAAENRFRRALGCAWLSRIFLGRGDLTALANSFQIGRHARQPNSETLNRELRDQILRFYDES